jgi:hypothetical protein
MHIHIIMDRTGDSRHEFDPDDVSALARAETHFRDLTSRGFRAVALGKHGEPGKLLTEFNREADEVLFIPQLQGG